MQCGVVVGGPTIESPYISHRSDDVLRDRFRANLLPYCSLQVRIASSRRVSQIIQSYNNNMLCHIRALTPHQISLKPIRQIKLSELHLEQLNNSQKILIM